MTEKKWMNSSISVVGHWCPCILVRSYKALKFVRFVKLSELRKYIVEMKLNNNIRSVVEVLHFYSKLPVWIHPFVLLFYLGPFTNLDSRFLRMR